MSEQQTDYVACVHTWACPGAVSLPLQNGNIAILLPLYCTKCSEPCLRMCGDPEPTARQKLTQAVAQSVGRLPTPNGGRVRS